MGQACEQWCSSRAVRFIAERAGIPNPIRFVAAQRHLVALLMKSYRHAPSIPWRAFSGGEPMQQADSLLGLMHSLREQAPELSFGMFSGYAEYELDQGQYWIWGGGTSEQQRKRLWQEIRASLDFAILGRFNQAQPGNMTLPTSRNQILRLFTDSYTPDDFSEQLTEVNINEGGRAQVTGFPTLGLPW